MSNPKPMPPAAIHWSPFAALTRARPQPRLAHGLATSALTISLISALALAHWPELGQSGAILSAVLGLTAVHLALRDQRQAVLPTPPAPAALVLAPTGFDHLERRFEQLQDLRWGMFVCWSFSTFSGKEWTPGVTNIERPQLLIVL